MSRSVSRLAAQRRARQANRTKEEVSGWPGGCPSRPPTDPDAQDSRIQPLGQVRRAQAGNSEIGACLSASRNRQRRRAEPSGAAGRHSPMSLRVGRATRLPTLTPTLRASGRVEGCRRVVAHAVERPAAVARVADEPRRGDQGREPGTVVDRPGVRCEPAIEDLRTARGDAARSQRDPLPLRADEHVLELSDVGMVEDPDLVAARRLGTRSGAVDKWKSVPVVHDAGSSPRWMKLGVRPIRRPRVTSVYGPCTSFLAPRLPAGSAAPPRPCHASCVPTQGGRVDPHPSVGHLVVWRRIARDGCRCASTALSGPTIVTPGSDETNATSTAVAGRRPLAGSRVSPDIRPFPSGEKHPCGSAPVQSRPRCWR